MCCCCYDCCCFQVPCQGCCSPCCPMSGSLGSRGLLLLFPRSMPWTVLTIYSIVGDIVHLFSGVGCSSGLALGVIDLPYSSSLALARHYPRARSCLAWRLMTILSFMCTTRSPQCVWFARSGMSFVYMLFHCAPTIVAWTMATVQQCFVL